MPSLLQNVGVNHGGGDVFVPQQGLNGSDIRASLKQMGGKAVPIMPNSA